jgi:hypothetical protein
MKKLFVIGTLGLTIALQAATALAGSTIYPGSMCVRFGGGHVVPGLSHSRIFNSSATQEMYVDCPILHQNFGLGGNDMDDADIGVIDASSSRDVSCWLASRYQVGSNIYGTSGGTRVSSGFGNHEQNLDFNPTGINAENWYYIGCNVPRSEFGRQSGNTYYRSQE